MRKQQPSAKAIANRAAEHVEMETTLQTYAIQQISDTTRSEALAAGATKEEAHATT
jgi:hypothetical protein